jgi:hypothetical protein
VPAWVRRFGTITVSVRFHEHGRYSWNTPARGMRHMRLTRFEFAFDTIGHPRDKLMANGRNALISSVCDVEYSLEPRCKGARRVRHQ